MAHSSSPGPDFESFAALDLETLQQSWRQRFKNEPPALRSAPLLARALAYRFQAQRNGGLKPGVRRKLEAMAIQFASEPRYAPAPLQSLNPGSVLIRDWQGKRYGVTVSDTGFLFDGRTYASLSAVATTITGVKRNGPLFFGLNEKEAEAIRP